MELTDIEGLAAAELKKRRDELVAEAAKAPVEQLAARYVQARTDATRRDEKLAEQGETIAHLQKALDASAAREEQTAAEAETLRGARDAAIENGEANAREIAKVASALAAAREQAAKATELANKQHHDEIVGLTNAALRADDLAKARRAALADVMTLRRATVGEGRAAAGGRNHEDHEADEAERLRQ